MLNIHQFPLLPKECSKTPKAAALFGKCWKKYAPSRSWECSLDHPGGSGHGWERDGERDLAFTHFTQCSSTGTFHRLPDEISIPWRNLHTPTPFSGDLGKQTWKIRNATSIPQDQGESSLEQKKQTRGPSAWEVLHKFPHDWNDPVSPTWSP